MSADVQSAQDQGPAPGRVSLRGSGEPAGRLPGLLREIGAGATVGLITLPICVTAGVLAYEPLGRDHIGAGAAAGILCGVAGGLIGALVRTSSFIPNTTPVGMALIQATFLSTLLGALGGDTAAALVIMPLSIICAGLWQMLIAVSGLTRVVKFTPYPVLAGFVTGLAVLTFIQQLPRLFDEPSLRSLVSSLAGLNLPSPAMPLFGLAVILFIRISEWSAPKLPAMLVALFVGTIAWHAIEKAWPTLGLGHTIGSVSLRQAAIGLKIDLDALRYVLLDRTILQSLLLTSLTIGLLGTLDYTFAFRSAQNLADLDTAPRRDLAGQGAANIASALVGGLAVTSSLAFARTNFDSGGRTRLSTVAVALVLLVAAGLAPSVIAALPLVVLSALLVSISLRMWDRWCVVVMRDMFFATDPSGRTRARRNALIVVAVMAATVLGQPVVGALAGVVVSCLVFIAEMSRPIVRREFDASQAFSKRIRSQHDRAILELHGRETLVLQLQGVLFFGNADDLAARIRNLEEEAEIIVLDLHRVTDLDTSGAAVLRQIGERCRDRQLRLVVCGARPTYRALLDESQADLPCSIVVQDLDAALEFAEDIQLGHEEASRTTWAALRLDQTDLAGGLSEREMGILSERLVPVTYRQGEALCRTGEPADKLWLITRGSVSVRLDAARHLKRVAGLGPGTSVGELGLLDRRPRSADVVADCEVETYVLSAEDFDGLMRQEPHLGQSLLATIARLTAQRLRATSAELQLSET
ncbi:SLC26A/SulP transporter family protein [uncultured Enterovirga sp.]|uniref:SLC26A/SulP transporter family protein n=1 Tax=uncultured Enterovirga sp. TaxID=2026352 RepID=UPI0035CA0213